KALNAAGTLAHYQGDVKSASSFLEEGLALWRRLGDRRGIAATMNNLGIALDTAGDSAAAPVLLEESLGLVSGFGEVWGITRVLVTLAQVVLGQGDRRAARALAGEAHAIEQEMGGQKTLQSLAAVVPDQGGASAIWTICRDALAPPVDP